MEFHVLDEVVEIEGTGLMLLANEEDCSMLCDGCKIRDIRGNIHIVDNVASHEGLTSLLIRSGHANYFRRLFRDIFVDATLFVMEQTEMER